MPILSLLDRHLALGATLTPRAGWEIPAHYATPAAEYAAVRQNVGFVDRSFRGKLRLRGSDRTEFLQGMLTNDIQGLKPGEGCYAAITNAKAKMLSDCRLYCFEDSYLMDLEPETVEKVVKHLDFYIISSDVTIENLTEAWGMLSVFGPESAACLSKVAGTTTIPTREFHFVETKAGSVDVWVARNEITGELGYDLWMPAEGLATVFDALLEAGATCVGQEALNILRIEAGTPRYGTDMDESHFPMEAGLTERAISETKGCYIGQETIARALAQGHMNRSLMGLALEGDAVPDKGSPIRSGEKQLGAITGAVFSPTLKKVIAMGYVHREFATAGAEVSVDIEGKPVSAVVARLPFYKRNG